VYRVGFTILIYRVIKKDGLNFGTYDVRNSVHLFESPCTLMQVNKTLSKITYLSYQTIWSYIHCNHCNVNSRNKIKVTIIVNLYRIHTFGFVYFSYLQHIQLYILIAHPICTLIFGYEVFRSKNCFVSNLRIRYLDSFSEYPEQTSPCIKFS
jgi:hypothetical protein